MRLTRAQSIRKMACTRRWQIRSAGNWTWPPVGSINAAGLDEHLRIGTLRATEDGLGRPEALARKKRQRLERPGLAAARLGRRPLRSARRPHEADVGSVCRRLVSYPAAPGFSERFASSRKARTLGERMRLA